MAFQTSPGINVSEIDLTNATPAVGTTEGAIAGVFRWGPVGERVLISSEQQLVDRFGAPVKIYSGADFSTTWSNVETFYTAANFLGYSDALYVTRVATSGQTSASESDEGFSAKYPGLLGNSLSVSFCSGDDAGGNDVVGFAPTALQTPGTITITDSARNQASINGLSDASRDALTKGTKIILRDSSDNVLQKMTLSADAPTTVGGVVATDSSVKTFNPDTATTATLSDGGVAIDSDQGSAAEKIHVNLINIENHGFTLGQAVQYSAEGEGVVGGLVDGRTYFVIPVTPSTGGSFDAGGSVTGDTTDAIKLAATLEDAQTHTDAAPKNITLTARAATTTGTSKFKPFTSLNVTVTFEERFTGIINSIDTNDYLVEWGDADLFDAAPTAGSIHIVVRDEDGDITGTAGSILEVYENVSENPSSTKTDGTTNYARTLLEQQSNWIKITDASIGATGFTTTRSSNSLSGGADGSDEVAATIGELAAGYDLYVDPADVDISFVLQGKSKDDHVLANYIIDNVAEVRKDCVAFISPALEDTTVANIVSFANAVTASSYAVVDSGYKYQYDKYNDVYAYVPLNGDIAGLCARTDDLRDPWFSPAGYQRGNVKNVVKLLVNPTKAERDLLYKNSVNPVITQPGQGTVLFGDKTFSGVTSAFDRINVRRLFIVLEKTISQAAKSTLFEFNDEFTRAQFVNLVEPFLRDVQGRRGIYDFKVVCDESNNTAGVVDANQFVGDIFIKPARSINFIQLNFVAVRSGVEFSEIVGQA